MPPRKRGHGIGLLSLGLAIKLSEPSSISALACVAAKTKQKTKLTIQNERGMRISIFMNSYLKKCSLAKWPS
ncbi:MAG: hypothetical protein RL571_2496 [Pseudomonadota bacterium]